MAADEGAWPNFPLRNFRLSRSVADSLPCFNTIANFLTLRMRIGVQTVDQGVQYFAAHSYSTAVFGQSDASPKNLVR